MCLWECHICLENPHLNPCLLLKSLTKCWLAFLWTNLLQSIFLSILSGRISSSVENIPGLSVMARTSHHHRQWWTSPNPNWILPIMSSSRGGSSSPCASHCSYLNRVSCGCLKFICRGMQIPSKYCFLL